MTRHGNGLDNESLSCNKRRDHAVDLGPALDATNWIESMKFNNAPTLAFALFAFSGLAAQARELTPDYSNDEQTMCQPDVFRLCNDAVPDEDRIIACMKVKHTQLSPQCRKLFDAGLKKRGL